MVCLLIPAEKAQAATPVNAWDYATVTYKVTADNYGRYIADADNPMVVDKVVDEFGNELATDEYVVVYFNDLHGNGIDKDDTIVKDSVNGVPGAYPKTDDANYAIVVFSANAWNNMKTVHPDWFDENGNPTTGWKWSSDIDIFTPYKSQAFRIAAPESANEFAGAYAYEGTDVEDTSFQFTGAAFNVKIAVGDEQLTITDYADAKYRWTKLPTGVSSSDIRGNLNDGFGVTHAGDYELFVYDNDGNEATVPFTVDPIDLSSDVITIKTANGTDGYSFGGGFLATNNIYVNGKQVASGQANNYCKLQATLKKLEKASGETVSYPATNNGLTDLGVYTFSVADGDASTNTADGNDVIGGPIEVTGLVVTDVVSFFYGNDSITSGYNKNFVTANKEGFDPDELAAYVGSGRTDEADFDYTVTKDGVEVNAYDEPGDYVVELTSGVTPGFASAGSAVMTFTVVEKNPVAIEDAFFQVDGKAIDSTFTYNGKAYTPTVVAYDAKGNKLVEGEDYTVSYRITSSDKAVESMVDADTYEIVVAPVGDDNEGNYKIENFTISKATIKSATTDRELYAWTGEAIVPSITANTKADGTGLSLEVSADNASITYKKWDGTSYVLDDAQKPTDQIDWTNGADAVAAKDLKDEGVYQATVTLPSTMDNYEGTATAVFEISKTAEYADVDAGQWYAQFVYTAAKDGYGYMTGIPGTNLFMPEASITRAQTAQVLFNMAGGVSETGYYPTAFSDVNGWAWYAQPIAWASQASIVTGIGDTGAFAPDENVTREQAATMLYRYVKAQGKDASATADLSQYADGASVSDWAAEAMSWAVDADVFGVGTDVLRPQDTLTRAEMAAIAVRVQPDGAIE